MTLWTVYDHPRDEPDFFVVRRFENDQPTAEAYFCHDLGPLRSLLEAMNLTCVGRQAADDPVIVEVWI